MHKSFLIPKAMAALSGKRCAGKPARIVWEGGNGEGPFRYLAGALLHLEGANRKRNCKVTSSVGYPTTMMVSTRLWLGGVVQLSRDRSLADRLMVQVRRSAQALRPLLVLTDGWSAYPNSIRRAIRSKIKQNSGVGRACLQVWPQLHIGTVIKRTQNKRVVEITRKMTHGVIAQAEKLLLLSHGGSVPPHCFHRALEWNVPGTVGQLDA
jgi:hypothetical protein